MITSKTTFRPRCFNFMGKSLKITVVLQQADLLLQSTELGFGSEDIKVRCQNTSISENCRSW